MHCTFKAIVSEKYYSEKSNRHYLTLVDISTGHMVKLSTVDQPKVEPGSQVDVNIEADTRLDKSGGNYLIVKGGKITTLPTNL